MAKRHKKKYGEHKCQFELCSEDATWTTSGIVTVQRREYACSKHLHCITDKEDTGYMSLGDEQSWGRL